MTIQGTFEERLAAWYLDDAPSTPPPRLRAVVMAIPDRRRPSPLGSLALPWARARAVVVLALVGAAVLGLTWAAATGSLELRPTYRSEALPVAMDACDVLVSAYGPNRVPGGQSGDHGMTSWGAHVCVNGGWDGSYEDRHLLLRMTSTSANEARRLIEDGTNWSDTNPGPSLAMEWTELQPGVWEGRSGDAGDGEPDPSAIAVSHEPWFFIVTAGEAWQALRWAQDVAAVLGFKLDVDAQVAPGIEP